MPGTNNPTSVSLDVRNFASNGGGWKDVIASNGATYSYLYTGGNAPGNKNNGDVEYAVGGGNAAITVGLIADARYQFQGDITFTPPSDQLTSQGNAPRLRVVNDRCTAAVESKYTALVVDTNANNATIPCDPVIVNK
jgi:hypothetical protein